MPFADYKTSREILLRWLLAAGLFALLLVCFSPAWGAFRLWSRVPELSGMLEVRRGVSVLAQVEHPGAEIADELHRAIQWRLSSRCSAASSACRRPHCSGSPTSAACSCWRFSSRCCGPRISGGTETTLATLVLGAASWFFTSTGWLGYFDAWLALALLIAAFARSRWLVWLACLLAPWIDERFVIAAPLALLCRWLHRPGNFDLRRDAGIPVALLGAFVGVRLGWLADRSSASATVGGYLGGRDFLAAPLSRIALGIWEGLRGGWCFVAAAVLAFRPQRARALILGLALAGLMALGLATAQDYSRSMTMLLPAAVLGLLAARAAAWLPLGLRACAAVALLVPAHHVMNDRVNPIFNLQHEVAALDSPPAVAMPELYELRAIHAMERGEFPQADADLALAIKLASNPSSPAKQRGILAASQGRWTDARACFLLMAKHDPENPDAWLMCAQARHALGELAAARSDFERAVSLAPADWKTRPDVVRFMAKLNAAGAGR